jgi:hypothetical protein
MADLTLRGQISLSLQYVWRTKCATSSYDSTNECTVQYCSTAPTVQYCAYHSLPSSPQIQRARHNYLCTSQLHAKKFGMLPLTVSTVWRCVSSFTSPHVPKACFCHPLPQSQLFDSLTPHSVQAVQYSTVTAQHALRLLSLASCNGVVKGE